jgi:hypothetical protein
VIIAATGPNFIVAVIAVDCVAFACADQSVVVCGPANLYGNGKLVLTYDFFDSGIVLSGVDDRLIQT